MGVKKAHRVFFAIPYDVATRSMYDSVASKLKEEYPGITTVIGKEEVGPSRDYSKIATFKAHNQELFDQFVSQIRSADVIVADLTHNNPSVHVELGIGLTLNKNILRVTGRALTELGFDIRGFEVYPYKGDSDLTEKILGYLRMFMEIKNLPLSEEAGPLYRHYPDVRDLSANEPRGFQHHSLREHFRDGAIRVQFEFKEQQTDGDWFGIFLRSNPVHPMVSSYLVYVRRNGWVELATYPWRDIKTSVVKIDRLVPTGISSKKLLLVEIEGDTVRASIDGQSRSYDRVEVQNPGLVALGCLQSSVSYSDVRVVCRDTIEY